MKRHLSVLGVTVAALALGVGIAFAMGILSLPSDPVCVAHGPWNQGANSTIDITLSSVPFGFDVTNGLYAGWCVEDNHQDDYDGCDALLLDSTDTEELECGEDNYPGYQWDKVNYLLNHKNGTNGNIPATIKDIQVAMWLLNGTYGGTWGGPTPEAWALVDDADIYGAGFMPGPGEVVAVVICSDGDSGRASYQDTLIELELPEDFEGCTPGYWKQSQHLFAWAPTGYAPSALYGTVFGVDDSLNLTLLQALKIGGGGENALYRHATAALLNAAHPDVAYPYTVAYVISRVQYAYSSGMFEGVKNEFAAANQAGCPLGGLPQ